MTPDITSRVFSLAFLAVALGALTAPANAQLDDRTAARPPDWYGEHIDYLTRDGGRWATDNAAYQSESETFPEYVVVFRSDFGGASASGRLFGRTDGVESVDFWAYRHFFDPLSGQVRLAQHGWGGAYGVGPTRRLSETEYRTEQVFISPGGRSRVQVHLFTVLDEDRHETLSWAEGPDGERLNERTYVWVREPAGDEE